MQTGPLGAHPEGESSSSIQVCPSAGVAVQPGRLPLDLHGKRVYVEWDPRTVRKITATQLCGLPVVVAEHAAQALSTVNLTCGWKRRKFRPDDLVLKGLMIAFGVVMNHELADGPVQ